MKFINGAKIIREVLDSYKEYEILPPDSEQFILRLIDDLKYERKVKNSTLEHYFEVFPHLFEQTELKEKEKGD